MLCMLFEEVTVLFIYLFELTKSRFSKYTFIVFDLMDRSESAVKPIYSSRVKDDLYTAFPTKQC